MNTDRFGDLFFHGKDRVERCHRILKDHRYFAAAQVKNSLLGDGCVIEGTVENSILSRGVRVQKGAVVRNAVIMQDGYIMSGAHVECCILDKQVIVREGSTLTAPATYPLVVAKDTIV